MVIGVSGVQLGLVIIRVITKSDDLELVTIVIVINGVIGGGPKMIGSCNCLITLSDYNFAD